MKYLFTAHYSDGTSFSQTPEDKSLIKEGKSAYYDICHEKLTMFELKRADNPNIKVLINLISGEIEQISDGFHTKLQPPESLSNFRLIYYRSNTVTTGSPYVSTVFCVGWQTTQNGYNHKRIIEIF